MKLPFAALAIALTFSAHADPLPHDDTLSFDSNGQAEVNGSLFQEGMAQKPGQLSADVAKVISGPEGSTILFLKPVEAKKANGEKIPVSGEARPFMLENDWKMYDAEWQLTTDARWAQHVVMPYPMDVADAMFDVIWNECEGSVSGNYMGMPCNKKRGLSDDYMAFLNKYYLSCVNQALGKVGLPAAAKVHITHDGTMADEKHNKGSLHTVGRAIDLMVLTTVSANGKQNTFDFTKTNPDARKNPNCLPEGRDCKFFSAFRNCWGNIHSARGGCTKRNDGYPLGTIAWEDQKHVHHHMHISYPFCPNKKGMFITNGAK